VSVQDRCSVSVKRTLAQKRFGRTRWALLGDEAQMEARFGAFRDIANPDTR